jgi:hypothetical protein
MLAHAGTYATAAPAAQPQVAQPSRLPPLVLLSPEEATSKRTPAAPAAAAAAPPKPATTRSSPTAANAGAARAARRAEKADAVPPPHRAVKADTVPPSHRPPKADAATARTAAKAPPRRPARTAIAQGRKTAPATTTSSDAGADTDVALISAIIMHSSKHAAERAKAEAAPTKPAAKR